TSPRKKALGSIDPLPRSHGPAALRRRVDAAGGKVDGMSAPGFEDELQHRLGVEVVELDGFADAAAHQNLDAPLCPAFLERVGVLLAVHHAGDVLDTLSVLVEPFLVDAVALERLYELDHQARLDLAFGPE